MKKSTVKRKKKRARGAAGNEKESITHAKTNTGKGQSKKSMITEIEIGL